MFTIATSAKAFVGLLFLFAATPGTVDQSIQAGLNWWHGKNTTAVVSSNAHSSIVPASEIPIFWKQEAEVVQKTKLDATASPIDTSKTSSFPSFSVSVFNPTKIYSYMHWMYTHPSLNYPSPFWFLEVSIGVVMLGLVVKKSLKRMEKNDQIQAKEENENQDKEQEEETDNVSDEDEEEEEDEVDENQDDQTVSSPESMPVTRSRSKQEKDRNKVCVVYVRCKCLLFWCRRESAHRFRILNERRVRATNKGIQKKQFEAFSFSFKKPKEKI